MKLALPETETGIKFVDKLSTNLSKKFEVTKSSSLESAIKLAIYLFVLGRNKQAMELLDSFVFNIPEDHRGYLLGNKIDGISVLAYFCYKIGEKNKQSALSKQIISLSDNIDIDDMDWFVDEANDELEYFISDRDTLAAMINSLSKQEIIDGYASHIIKFAFFHSVIVGCFDKRYSDLSQRLGDYLDYELQELERELL
jgi:hypothetical protein